MNTEPPASKNPKFPPIAQRFQTLMEVSPADLIAWAGRLGKQVDNRGDAIDAILSHEYGEEKCEQWASLISDHMAARKPEFYLKTLTRLD